MKRLRQSIAIAAVLFTSAVSLAANREMLNSSDASMLGLEQAWQATLQAGAGLGNLSDLALHASNKAARKYIEIHDGDKMIWRKSVLAIDPVRGVPLGEKAVRKLAERELIGLKSLGIKGEIKEQTVARIFLYALGRDGTVQCLDAETGETIWVNRYGNPKRRTFTLGVNDDYVAYVCGSEIYQLSATNGDLVGSRLLRTVPVKGPLIVGDYMMMNTAGGGLEGRFVGDIHEAPFLGMTSGQATANARTFPESNRFAWPTTRGYVYCMEAGGTPSELFRLRAPGVVTGEIGVVGQDLIYYGCESGHVYCVQATREGTLKWSLSLGEPIHGNTEVFGENVYSVSSRGNLYAVNATKGALAWSAPASKVDHVIGAIGDRVFVQDHSSQLVSLSAKSGARMSTARYTQVHRSIINRLTDRLYMITTGGSVQCLRPVGKTLPTLKVAVEFKEEKKAPVKPNSPNQVPNNVFEGGGDGGIDPFGNNPFDAPGAGPAAGNDPFGGGDAPAANNDPFGGADAGAAPTNDPFGDSPF